MLYGILITSPHINLWVVNSFCWFVLICELTFFPHTSVSKLFNWFILLQILLYITLSRFEVWFPFYASQLVCSIFASGPESKLQLYSYFTVVFLVSLFAWIDIYIKVGDIPCKLLDFYWLNLGTLKLATESFPITSLVHLNWSYSLHCYSFASTL